MAESIVKQYYDNLKNGTLIAARCKSCGGITFPPTTACEHCGSMDMQRITLSGKGQLLFVTHSIAPPPNPRFAELAPYAYGHVKLEEGVYVQGIVTNVGIEPEALRKVFEKGPVAVRGDVIEAQGLPILAFRVEGA